MGAEHRTRDRKRSRRRAEAGGPDRFGDEHVGIVRDVLPNGQIQTIEGNYENKVAANVRSPTEATGYVERVERIRPRALDSRRRHSDE